MSQTKKYPKKRKRSDVNDNDYDYNNLTQSEDENEEKILRHQRRRMAQESEEEKTKEDNPLMTLFTDDYNKLTSELATCNSDFKAVLSEAVESPFNVGIGMTHQKDADEYILTQFFRHYIQNQIKEIFEQFVTKTISKPIPFLLFGDSPKPEYQEIVQELWEHYLRYFFEMMIARKMENFPASGLTPISSVIGDRTTEEVKMVEQVIKFIQYEGKELPATLLGFVSYFEPWKYKDPEHEIISEGKIEWFTSALIDSINNDDPSSSYLALEYFRDLYKGFTAHCLTNIFLIGGEMLPAKVHKLWITDDLSNSPRRDDYSSSSSSSSLDMKYSDSNKKKIHKKNKSSTLFQPCFNRLVHFYDAWCSLENALIEKEKEQYFLFSTPWKSLVKSNSIVWFMDFYKLINQPKPDYYLYKTKSKRLMQDLLVAYLIEAFEKQKHEEFISDLHNCDNGNEMEQWAARSKKHLEAKMTMFSYFGSFLRQMWCRHKKVWKKYWENLVLTLTYTKSKVLADRKNSEDGKDSKVLEEKQLAEHKQLLEEKLSRHSEQIEKYKSLYEKAIVNDLNTMIAEYYKSEHEQMMLNRQTEKALNDSLLREKEVVIHQEFTPLVFFFDELEAHDYNVKRLSTYCRTLAFNSSQTLMKMSNAKIFTSNLFHIDKSFSPERKQKKDQKLVLFDLNNYDWLKTSIKKKKGNKEQSESKDDDCDDEKNKKLFMEFMKNHPVPFCPVLPFSPGITYRLTMPKKIGPSIVPEGSLFKLQNFYPLKQKRLSYLDSNQKMYDNNDEIAAWLKINQEESKMDRVEELESILDGRYAKLFDMDIDEYKKSDYYQKKQEHVRNLQKQLGTQTDCEVPYMNGEKKNVFEAFPLTFNYKIQNRTFYISQYPFKPGYAISYKDLGPSWNKEVRYNKISVSSKILIEHPLILFNLLTHCDPQNLEIVPEVPDIFNQETVFKNEAKKKEDTINEIIAAFIEARQKVAMSLFESVRHIFL